MISWFVRIQPGSGR